MHIYDRAQQNDQYPPYQLITLVLRGFILAYSKTVDLAYSEFSKGHVLDGEDCWLDHYGLPVQMTDPVDEVLDVLDQSLNWLDLYDGMRWETYLS